MTFYYKKYLYMYESKSLTLIDSHFQRKEFKVYVHQKFSRVSLIVCDVLTKVPYRTKMASIQTKL